MGHPDHTENIKHRLTHITPDTVNQIRALQSPELAGMQELALVDNPYVAQIGLKVAVYYYDNSTLTSLGINNPEAARALCARDRDGTPTDEELAAIYATREQYNNFDSAVLFALTSLNQKKFETALREAGLPETIKVPKSEQLINKTSLLEALKTLGAEFRGEIDNPYHFNHNLPQLNEMVMIVEFDDGTTIPVPLANLSTSRQWRHGISIGGNIKYPFCNHEQPTDNMILNGPSLNIPDPTIVFDPRKGTSDPCRQSPFKKRITKIRIGRYPNLRETQGPISLGTTSEDGSLPTTTLIATGIISPQTWAECTPLLIHANSKELHENYIARMNPSALPETVFNLMGGNDHQVENRQRLERETICKTGQLILAIDPKTEDIVRTGILELRNLGISTMSNMALSIDGHVIPPHTTILVFRTAQELIEFLHAEWK